MSVSTSLLQSDHNSTYSSTVINVSSPGNTYWNVPRAPNPLFTGRRDLLNIMKNHLVTVPKKEDRPVFVLQGIGGAGKSETAVKFATEFQDRCFAWLELR